MAKATRKHATHHKKARGHHAVKAQAHRPHASKTAAESRPMVVQQDAEIIEEEFSARPESSRVVDDLDDEVGIYGANRGEDAG